MSLPEHLRKLEPETLVLGDIELWAQGYLETGLCLLDWEQMSAAAQACLAECEVAQGPIYG